MSNFPGGSDGKASTYNVGDPGSIPGSGRSPGEGNGNPLQYSCLENPVDGGVWEAVVSPWGHKESDTTEQLHFHSMVHNIFSCTLSHLILQHCAIGVSNTYKSAKYSSFVQPSS